MSSRESPAELEPFDPTLSALLDAERARPGVPAESMERLRARLDLPLLPAPVVGPGPGGHSRRFLVDRLFPGLVAEDAPQCPDPAGSGAGSEYKDVNSTNAQPAISHRLSLVMPRLIGSGPISIRLPAPERAKMSPSALLKTQQRRISGCDTAS